jgi:hypothetical protein
MVSLFLANLTSYLDVARMFANIQGTCVQVIWSRCTKSSTKKPTNIWKDRNCQPHCEHYPWIVRSLSEMGRRWMVGSWPRWGPRKAFAFLLTFKEQKNGNHQIRESHKQSQAPGQANHPVSISGALRTRQRKAFQAESWNQLRTTAPFLHYF